MEHDDLPDLVRDYRLEVQFISKYEVAQISDDPDAPPSSPRRTDRWRRDKRSIGSGGQGQVYLQRCTRDGQVSCRAVKVISIQEGSGKRRYIRELATLSKFAHRRYFKHFVELQGWYESKDRLYIVMEYLPDGDLHTYLCESRFPEDDSRQIISQVLQGLAVMHSEGFAHRDIKPKNVLIKSRRTPEGPHTWWVKLADFGISKRIQEASGASTVVGTEEYIAPELRRNIDPARFNYPAADMWAVGAMTFRMLTQNPVFLNVWETFKYLDDPDRLFPQAPLGNYHVSLDGQTFIRALLRPQPDQRLDSRGALLHAWVKPCMPDTPTMITDDCERSSTPSSGASSRRSSFDEDTGLTTRVSSLTMDFASIGQPTTTPGPQNSYDNGPTMKPAPAMVSAAPVDQPNDKGNSPTATVSQISSVELEPPEMSKGRTSTPESNSPIVQVSPHLDEKLIGAAKRGQEEVVRMLLEKGADMESKDNGGRIPLSYAAYFGHEAVVKLLLEKGADMESKGYVERTPLFFAASGGHEAVVKLLLEKGADMESKDNGGRIPLSYAAYFGHEAVVKLLLEKGADMESKGYVERTPLSFAASGGHEAVVKLLLEKGANMEFKDKDGDTPLSCATYEGHEAVVKLLLEKGADMESKDKDGDTPLSCAAYEGHEAVVKLLLEKGADMESKNYLGWTPLFCAACEGHEAVVKLLLEKGADMESKDKYGNTALGCAKFSGRKEVIKLLKDAARWKRRFKFW